jgi:hypothetical protein
MIQSKLSHQDFADDAEAAMRTTVDIPEKVLDRVRNHANARSISQTAAVVELVERGLDAKIPIVWENGIPVFSPGPEGAVTMEHVQELIEQMDDEAW